jgi:Protein of unknown function (DUF1552)
MKTKITRRTTLRGLIGGAATAIALPRLDAMLNGNGTAYAAGGALPRRFGVWAWANGAHPDTWFPATTGANLALPDQLSPLEPVKDVMMVVGGMLVPHGPGRGHAGPNTQLMTGRATTPPSIPTGGSTPYTASSPSIDQLVAAQIGMGTAVKSLQVGVDKNQPPEGGTSFHWWSHNGPNSPNPCTYSCRDVFNQLFSAGTTASPPPADGGTNPALAAAKLRKSILDAVLDDSKDLRAILGTSDQRRLDQHLDGIRSIESRLSLMGQVPSTASANCMNPTAPDPTLVGAAESYDIKGKLVNKTMSDLVAMALACDITRVFVFQLVQPGSLITIPSLNVTSQYHALTHSEWTGPRCRSVVKLFMSELSVFIQTLKGMGEAGGSLIDNCAIMATCDCNQGPTHGVDNYPILTFGKAGGLRTNYFYKSPTAQNACLVPYTLATAVGANLGTFGDGDGTTTAPLAALLGP